MPYERGADDQGFGRQNEQGMLQLQGLIISFCFFGTTVNAR
jgi:hypothetical protein